MISFAPGLQVQVGIVARGAGGLRGVVLVIFREREELSKVCWLIRKRCSIQPSAPAEVRTFAKRFSRSMISTASPFFTVAGLTVDRGDAVA